MNIFFYKKRERWEEKEILLHDCLPCIIKYQYPSYSNVTEVDFIFQFIQKFWTYE